MNIMKSGFISEFPNSVKGCFNQKSGQACTLHEATGHSCPILSHRVHPTKQRSICCRSEKFHLISEKWTKCCRFDRFVRFVKWKSLLSIRQVRSAIGQLHLISDDGDPVKVLSIRSIRSICQMEKFSIDSTSAVVDRTIASH